MDVLSFTFIVIVLGVVGFAWAHLRSNWRSVQSMRAENKTAADEPGLDLPGGLGHGHEG
jgi:hypothetical protein